MEILKVTNFILLLLFFNKSYLSANEVKDFEAMIYSKMEKSFGYVLPTDNKAYFPDDLPDSVTEQGGYDFIVVGAGSAGAIVAKRLSDSGWKVLLMEAGTQEDDFTDIPVAWELNLFSEYNWGYMTKEQAHTCQGMINKQCIYPRGKGLGGTSLINDMLYLRGNPLDWDYWQEFGITGWTFQDVLPFFKKLENYQKIYGDPGYHGYHGPVPIDYARPPNFLINIFLEAYDEIGDITKDYNGEVFMGAGLSQYSQMNGRRASTYKCYLKKANSNLTILTQTLAYKILINDKKKAIGVEFVRDKNRYKAFCIHEVIVSAGVVNTPQLLMLSGIGPMEELSKHNIPVVQNLPVGQNFEDHVVYPIQFETSFKKFDLQTRLEQYIWDYFLETGPMTTTASFAYAFVSTNDNKNYPDVEIAAHVDVPVIFNLRNTFNFDGDIENILVGGSISKLEYLFQIIFMLLHPKSKGTVTLKSSNPIDYPVIDPNSLSDPEDVESLYRSLDYINKLLETNTFKQYDVKLADRTLPACAVHEYLSKEFWICQMKQYSLPNFHGVGTCRMGTSGVVDNKFRVHGVKKLRVIDASVIPRSPSGHTNAIAMMMGERGAHFIKSDY